MGATYSKRINKHNFRNKVNKANEEIHKKYNFQINPIGHGAFSHVYLASPVSMPNLVVAIKSLTKFGMTKVHVDSIHDEIEILAKLEHSNIIKYFESYEDKYNVFIVTEYLQGYNLGQHLKQKQFTEFGAASVMNQLVDAIKY